MYDLISTKDIIDILYSFFQKKWMLNKYKLLCNKLLSHDQSNIQKNFS